MQRAAGKQLFSDVSVRGSFGPMRRTRPVRGEPRQWLCRTNRRAWAAARAMPALELSVVGDLDF